MAAILGGAVTRERLLRAATREGRAGLPLIHSLLAQSLPSTAGSPNVCRHQSTNGTSSQPAI